MEDMRRGDGLKALVAAYERQLIESALSAAEGNQRRAAASLGLLPTTLHEKMKRLGLLRRHMDSIPEQPAVRRQLGAKRS